MTIIATICARGGSIGLPEKNIKDFCGKPLIIHTIEQALSCSEIDYVFVSTDDAKIAQISAEAGAKVPFIRPQELSTSQAGKIPVIEHLVNFVSHTGLPISKIVDLQPTSPLRNLKDIVNCINLLTKNIDNVFSVCESDKNPYFTLVEIVDDYPRICKAISYDILSRQAAPKVYAMNGAIYVWHRETLSKGVLEGKGKCYIMPKDRSIDIDDEIDFALAELLFKRKKTKHD